MTDARRLTFRMPGSTPSLCSPAFTQEAMASQILSSPSAISSSERSASSLRRAASAMVMPCSSHSASSVAASV